MSVRNFLIPATPTSRGRARSLRRRPCSDSRRLSPSRCGSWLRPFNSSMFWRVQPFYRGFGSRSRLGSRQVAEKYPKVPVVKRNTEIEQLDAFLLV